VHRIAQREGFLTLLVKNNQECGGIRVGLMGLLERRRGKFPRLFFLSNEELIELFGAGPELVESILEGEASASFVTSLFEGIESLSFHEVTSAITHIHSRDGEKLLLAREAVTRGLQVDTWLRGLEASMVLTAKDSVFRAFAEMGTQEVADWVSTWPGQATSLCGQLWFTLRVRAIFVGCAEGLAQR
jgi:dynein heavy chain